tara:strand:+ start:83559 stop:84563 length:1005 start_codon:yes stop_codon:yes gene_type:complete
MKIRKTIVLFISIFIVACSCDQNRLKIDIPNTNIDQKFVYVDEFFHNATKEETSEHHRTLKSELDQLYVYELQQNIQTTLNDSFANKIYEFYHSEYISALETEKEKLFSDAKAKEENITKAFSYFNYHFNEAPIPQNIIYMNKLFSNIHCSDSSVSIGLESYLSPKNKIIESIPKNQLYDWQRKRMDIQYLERDILLNWIQVHLFNEIDKQLAQHIIQAGKILYILNASFPEAEERYIVRYNEDEWKWAEENEQLTWDFLVKEQLLFKNNRRDKANFLNAGPTSVGLPEESPDRMGQYLGYKMVRGFMQENKDVSLQDLLTIDYNKILQSYEIN